MHLLAQRGGVMRKDVRNNTRVMSDHVEDANYLWERLKPFLPAKMGTEWHVTGLNERFRFYRYEPGQYFAWHYDGCFRRNEIEESLYTLMVYLNDDFTGGETKFELKYPHEQVVVTPKKGMALLFEHYQFHEGSAVTAGIKYVLRSDVMYRRGHGPALLNLVK